MDTYIREHARANAKGILGSSETFLRMPHAEQLALYGEVLVEQERALTSPGATTSVALAQPEERAGDLIDDRRHENRRIDQAGQLAGEFIDEVDLPQFVRDLLEGVFDANLQVTVQQMTAYQELLKTATQSLAKFVQEIDPAASFAYLAENNSDEFNFDWGDEDNSGERQPVLTDKEGNVLATGNQEIGDNEVKARIMDAKIRMAQEERALLRETILMGITRLVVEKGVVKASVLFDVKATEKIAKQDKACISSSRGPAPARGTMALAGQGAAEGQRPRDARPGPA